MNTVLILLALLVPFSDYAQDNKAAAPKEVRGSGRLVRETKVVRPFDGIDINHFPARIVVEAGAQESSVSISIDDNLRPLLQIEDKNGTLKLSFKEPANKPYWVSRSNIDVIIRTPMLQRFKHGSNSSVEVNGLRGESFAFVNEGNGSVQLRGQVRTLDLVSTANGSVDAEGLLTTTVNVMTQADAVIRVNAEDINALNSGNAEVINVNNELTNQNNEVFNENN